MSQEKPPMDPNKVMCVAKKDGKEVGRKAASAPGITAWVDELARTYGGIQIEYVEDAGS